jgi:predicted dienelactone hydrolase
METQTIRDDTQGADIVVHTLGRGPQVVFSHGTGSNVLLMRGLAEAIAATGYSVALVEHPGNKRGDDALAHTAANLVNRPRHVRLVLDGLGAKRSVVIGHSLGGYTALALAGGEPMALPDQMPDGKAAPLVVEHDARVAGCVLLAPAIPWFMAPDALANVAVPVLALLGEKDDAAPPFFAQRILAGVPHADVRVIPDAGHFPFFWPLPPHLVAAKLPPAMDPPGFDRAAYQATLHADVLAFLGATAWA